MKTELQLHIAVHGWIKELLSSVNKDSIISRLEPLTIKYYHVFHLCSTCDKIYWAGSHTDNMQQYLDAIKGYRPLPD